MADRRFLCSFAFFFTLVSLFALYGCGGAVAARQADASPAPAAQAAPAREPGPSSGQVAECWQPLLERLQKDPGVRKETLRYLCDLPEYSPLPMGVKVKELFTSAFLRKKRVDDGTPKPPPSRIYRNVVTAATVQKCNDFLDRNKAVFDAVEKKYPVPREILVSLLYVETRLGTYLGKDNALWSLACMAAADTPERMAGGMDDIPITDGHKDWLQAKLTDKSRWAYNELRALLDYCDTHKLDPFSMPGSVYGAIGICQFMPSNIVPYGDSGSDDGVVNLFSEPDAIFSAARYLSKHGWGTDMSVDRQRSVIKRYNNLNIYANTILALGESVRTGVLQTGPPDMAATVAVASKKKPAATKKPTAAPQAKTKKKAASSGKKTTGAN
ncbi:MAG: lytic murein transglycosylase [Desulfovibrionaceae bacterium]|nr:lytic murein transglycosylase [Desulfovibrionaceae bacterium]